MQIRCASVSATLYFESSIMFMLAFTAHQTKLVATVSVSILFVTVSKLSCQPCALNPLCSCNNKLCQQSQQYYRYATVTSACACLLRCVVLCCTVTDFAQETTRLETRSGDARMRTSANCDTFAVILLQGKDFALHRFLLFVLTKLM